LKKEEDGQSAWRLFAIYEHKKVFIRYGVSAETAASAVSYIAKEMKLINCEMWL
jgi:hypothetical protein